MITLSDLAKVSIRFLFLENGPAPALLDRGIDSQAERVKAR